MASEHAWSQAALEVGKDPQVRNPPGHQNLHVLVRMGLARGKVITCVASSLDYKDIVDMRASFHF